MYALLFAGYPYTGNSYLLKGIIFLEICVHHLDSCFQTVVLDDYALERY